MSAPQATRAEFHWDAVQKQHASQSDADGHGRQLAYCYLLLFLIQDDWSPYKKKGETNRREQTEMIGREIEVRHVQAREH